MRLLERARFFIKHYIYRKWYNSFVILSYFKKRALLRKYAQEHNLNFFVETGTFMGDTIEYLKRDFHQLFSIELHPELAKKVISRFQNEERVTILQGDSGEVLSSILPLEGKALFWLDGHHSSSFDVNGDIIHTAKGALDTPIIKELKTILLPSGLNENVILIDDARCFNGTNDYPTVKALKEILNDLISNTYILRIKNDILRISPKK